MFDIMQVADTFAPLRKTSPLSRIPALLIHGTRASAQVWRAQEHALDAAGYPYLSIDLPGHGTRAQERFSIRGAFDAINDAREKMGADRVALVGASLGGYVSIAYAAMNPGGVQGLMASGCSTETARWQARAYKSTTGFIAKKWEQFKEASPLLAPEPTEESLARPPWTVVTDMLHEMSQISYLENLRRLASPLWLVSGQWCPLRFGERSALRATKPAKHIVVPRVGHDVHIEAPIVYNGIMLRMLDSISTAHT